MSYVKRWGIVFVFALAMAWLESATVVYLRTKINRLEPYQANPLPNFISSGMSWGHIEIAREFATLVMLCAIGWLAGRTLRARWGFAAIAFGVWDICYYIWLHVMYGWPRSLLDWDILFLIPLPWWGPVLAPTLIACLLIVGGTLLSHDAWTLSLRRAPWLLSIVGALLALFVFMADAIAVMDRGADAIRNVLPVWFNWPLFGVALALMASPIVDMVWQAWQRRTRVTQNHTPQIVERFVTD